MRRAFAARYDCTLEPLLHVEEIEVAVEHDVK